MTTYTDHSDILFDVGKPILGQTQLEKRDNLIAVTEGDPTAPKMHQKSIERLAAGTQVRSRKDSVLLGTGASNGHTLGFGQYGIVRCQIILAGGVSSLSTASIVRTRQGVATTLYSATAVTVDLDVSVEPGDSIELRVTVGGGASGGTWHFRFATDGSHIWAAPAARLENPSV